MVIGLSAILEGEDSFAKFVFDMFDEDGSGVLQPEEVENFSRVWLSNFYFYKINFYIIVTFKYNFEFHQSPLLFYVSLIYEHGEW